MTLGFSSKQQALGCRLSVSGSETEEGRSLWRRFPGQSSAARPAAITGLGEREGCWHCSAPRARTTNQEDRWRVKGETKQGLPKSPGHPSLRVRWASLLLNVPYTCLPAHFTGEINSREAGLFAEGRELGPKPTSPSTLFWGPSPQGHLCILFQVDTAAGVGEGWGVQPRQRL